MTVDLTSAEFRQLLDMVYIGNWVLNSAFWDVLSKECPASKVTVVGANRLPAAWKNSAGVPFPEMIRRILQRNQGFREKFNEPFDYEFVDA